MLYLYHENCFDYASRQLVLDIGFSEQISIQLKDNQNVVNIFLTNQPNKFVYYLFNNLKFCQLITLI